MPDPIEPTPEVARDSDRAEPRDRTKDAADAELTTASLAKAGETVRPAAEPSRSFADAADGERPEPLFAADETSRLRADWDQVQASFVDEPRQAVEQADRLVATAIKRLAEIFAEEKARLEGQWDRGGDVSTEDLRQALRRYRAFFGRVLSI
jgi:hypothetical protein